MSKKPRTKSDQDDPVVREVREARAKLWTRHAGDFDSVTSAASEAAARLGMKPARGFVPQRSRPPITKSKRSAA